MAKREDIILAESLVNNGSGELAAVAARPNDRLRAATAGEVDIIWGYEDKKSGEWVDAAAPELNNFYEVWQYCQLCYMLAVKDINTRLVDAGISGPAFSEGLLDYDLKRAIDGSKFTTFRRDLYKGMAHDAEHISVRNEGARAAVPLRASIPIVTDFPLLRRSYSSSAPTFNFTTYNDQLYNRGGAVLDSAGTYQRLFTFLEDMFGTDFWDIDKMVSADIPFDPNSLEAWGGIDAMFTYNEEEHGYSSQEFIEVLSSNVRSLRMISPAAKIRQGARKIRSVAQAREEVQESEDETVVQRAEQRFKEGLFRAGVEGNESENRKRGVSVRSFSLVVELELSSVAVEHVFGTPTPKVSDAYQWLVSNTKAIGEHYADYPEENNIGTHDDPKIWSEQFTPVAEIKDALDEQTPSAIRLGVDNLILSIETGMLCVPDIDTSNIEELYDTSGVEDDTGWSLSSYSTPVRTLADDTARQLRNRIRLIDNVNHKLIYTTGSATNSVLDMEIYTPVDATHILRHLNTPIGNNVNLERMMAVTEWAAKQLTDAEVQGFVEDGDLAEAYHNGIQIAQIHDASTPEELKENVAYGIKHSWREYVNRYSYGIQRWLRRNGDLSDPPAVQNNLVSLGAQPMDAIKLRNISPGSDVLILRPVARMLNEIAQRLIEDQTGWMNDTQDWLAAAKRDMSVQRKMRALATAYLISYIPRVVEIEAQVQVERDKLAPSTEQPSDDWQASALPGANPDFEYLPHQSGIHQRLAGSPKFVVLAADAGGGKTLLALSKSIEMISQGLVGRVLIVCPGYLVNNYIKDNLQLTGGKWNIFPIIRQTTQQEDSYDIIEDTVAQAKRAPRNTIFVTDYNFAKQGDYIMSYLDQRVRGFRNAELLQEIGFDMIICDESHMLKNASSYRTQAMKRLLGSVKYRYLMSGTVIDRNMQDLHTQIGLLDPTLLGREDEFYDTYALRWYRKNNRVEVPAWRPNWAAMLRQNMADNVAYVQVKKREWSALLPHKIERFHRVELTEAQREVYLAILADVQGNPEVQKKIKQARDKALKNPEESQGDNIDVLAQYLQRLEMMMTAPGKDPLGAELEGSDLVSPKVHKIAELCEEHIRSDMPGKILILTNFQNSRDAIYENLPKKLQRQALVYKAEEKLRHIPQFEQDDSLRIMIGIQSSLEVGYNLQYVSRLIRVEAVWNPGSMEQGESRIFRPDVAEMYEVPVEPVLDDNGQATGETRRVKYVDWVLVNRSIDITKTARLISRMIQKVKFDESDNPDLAIRQNYADLPDVELKSMNFDTIFSDNDFDAELLEHLDVYGRYQNIRIKDYESYKKNPNSLKSLVSIPDNGMSDVDKYVLDMPYTEGQNLPEEDKFGIQTVQEWASEKGIIAVTDDFYAEYADDDEADGTREDDDAKLTVTERARIATLQEVDLRGYLVHTQWGPGLVVRNLKNDFEVLYADSYSSSGWSTTKLAKGKVFLYKGLNAIELPRGGPKSWSQATLDEVLARIPTEYIQEATAADLDIQGEWTYDYGDYSESPIPAITSDKTEEDEQPYEKGDRLIVEFNDDEFYLGTVTKRTRNLLHVTFDDGDKERFDLPDTDGWIFGRTNAAENPNALTRKKATKLLGDSDDVIDGEEETRAEYELELYAMAVSDRIAISINSFLDANDENNENLDYGALQSAGFRHIGPYAYAYINTKSKMRSFYDTVMKYVDNGKIYLPKAYQDDLDSTYNAMMESRTKVAFLEQLSQAQIRNFYLLDIRKNKNPNTVNLAMVVEDGELLAMIDYSKNRRGRWLAQRNFKVVQWEVDDDGAYYAFFKKKGEARSFVKRLADTFNITNQEEVLGQLQDMRVKANAGR